MPFTRNIPPREHRFPLPVSYSRAPRLVPLKTALLLGVVLFELGFFAGSIGVGFYLTAR